MLFGVVETHAPLSAPVVDRHLHGCNHFRDLSIPLRRLNVFVRGEVVGKFGDAECLSQDYGIDQLEKRSTTVALMSCTETLGWKLCNVLFRHIRR